MNLSELMASKKTTPTTEPTARPTVTPPSGAGTPYGLTALAEEAHRVATAAEGTRNDTLNRAAFSIVQLVAGGELNEQHAYDTLKAAARAVGLDNGEIDGTLASAHKAAELLARTAPPRADLPTGHVLEQTQAPSGEQPEEDLTELIIASEVQKLRIRREAERRLNHEEAERQWRIPTWRTNLTDELAIPDEPVTYLVDELHPTGGNILLASQYKTGKTTLMNNYAGALADNTPFLGRYPTHLGDGRIALWNYEVDDRQYRRWLRESGIRNTDAITVLNLRGYRMPITSPHVEDWVVNWLTQHHITVWIVDPFARAFTGTGASENDNSEVGVFLDTIDVIKERAGVSELVLPTHTGRQQHDQGQERARGATRLDDWADVRWLLTKDDHDTRFFRATGRDVDTDEQALEFDPTTRGLTIGGGDRHWERRKRYEDAVITTVRDNPGIGVKELRDAVKQHLGTAARADIDKAIVGAEKLGHIRVERLGAGRPTRHFPLGGVTLEEAS